MVNLSYRPMGSDGDNFKDSHRVSDVDADQYAQHHTLGKSPNQAAPGNHNHDDTYSPLGHTHVGLGGLDVGMVIEYPVGTIGAEYLEYNGQSVLRADYPELFALWGTVFGAVDATHFNVGPVTADAFPIGASGTKAVGDTGGGEALNITSPTQLPAHVHSFPHKHNVDHTHEHVHTHTIDHDHAAVSFSVRWNQTSAGGSNQFRVADVGGVSGASGGTLDNVNVDLPNFTGTSGAASDATTGPPSFTESGFNDTTNTASTGASADITLPLPAWYATRKIVRALP